MRLLTILGVLLNFVAYGQQDTIERKAKKYLELARKKHINLKVIGNDHHCFEFGFGHGLRKRSGGNNPV